MKVPLQHVLAASLSSILAPPPCADLNSVAFASAMQSLMQFAAPAKEPPARIIPDARGDHAKQEMGGAPGVRTWMNAQPTQDLSRSIQTTAAGFVITTPKTSSAGGNEIMEPVATSPAATGTLPPAAIHVLTLPNAMQESPIDTHVGRSVTGSASKDRIHDSAGHTITSEKPGDTSKQGQASTKSDPQGLPLTAPDAMLPIPVPPVAVEPPAPDKIVSKETAPAKVSRSILSGRSAQLQRPPLNPASVATTDASSEGRETIGKPTLPVSSKVSTPSSDHSPASELGHSEKDISPQQAWSPRAVLDANTGASFPVLAGKQPPHPRSAHADENGDPAGTMTPGHIEQDVTKMGPSQSKAEVIRIEPASPSANANANANAHVHLTVRSEAPQIHESGKIGNQHRPQEIAAQVLQRMDSAATGDSTQLQANKRLLEIGVAAGALGWVEVRATTGVSGRVDAMLHVQSDSSAHILAAQSPQIASFASQHSIQLGELSVNVGAGNSNRHRDPQPSEPATPEEGRVRESEDTIVAEYHATDRIGLINLRA